MQSALSLDTVSAKLALLLFFAKLGTQNEVT